MRRDWDIIVKRLISRGMEVAIGCESLYLDSFIEGNLREKTLREIWESPEAFAYNRKFRAEFLTGRCGECRYGALCAGGCRSYNYFTRGKLYESPFCARDVKGG